MTVFKKVPVKLKRLQDVHGKYSSKYLLGNAVTMVKHETYKYDVMETNNFT